MTLPVQPDWEPAACSNYPQAPVVPKCWAGPGPAMSQGCWELPITDFGLCERHYEEIIGEVGRANRQRPEAFDGTLGPVLSTVESWDGPVYLTPEFGDAA